MVSYKALNTRVKWISCHLDNTVWDVNAGQRIARGKRPFPNACYASRYIDAGKRGAQGKRQVSKNCHAVWDADAGQ